MLSLKQEQLHHCSQKRVTWPRNNHYVNFKIKAHVKKKKKQQLLHVKITKGQQKIRTPTTNTSLLLSFALGGSENRSLHYLGEPSIVWKLELKQGTKLQLASFGSTRIEKSKYDIVSNKCKIEHSNWSLYPFLHLFPKKINEKKLNYIKIPSLWKLN
jgi:hypothetical protein